MGTICLTENKLANLFPLGRGGGGEKLSELLLQFPRLIFSYIAVLVATPHHFQHSPIAIWYFTSSYALNDQGYIFSFILARGLHSPVWSKFILLKPILADSASVTSRVASISPLLIRWLYRTAIT